MEGVDIAIEKLYPPVEFPVSRGTPMISPLIKWDHTENWYVPLLDIQVRSDTVERKVRLSLDSDEYEFVAGHTIDGNIQLFRINFWPDILCFLFEFQDVYYFQPQPICS
jgi:fatty acid synthase